MPIFLSKSRIKNPLYKYGRHWLSQPMWIEAPVPYIRICPTTRSVKDTQIWILFYFKKKSNKKKFAIIGQFYEYAIQPEVSMTPAYICNTSKDQKSQWHMKLFFLWLIKTLSKF